MVPSVFLEDACQGLLGIIQQQLPAQMAAVWQKYASWDAANPNDAPPQPASVTVVLGDYQVLGPDRPAVCVYPQTLAGGQGVALQTTGWAEYSVLVAVEAFVVSPVIAVSERLLLRLLEALWLVIWTTQGQGGAYSAVPRRVQRLHIEGTERAARLEVEVGVLPQYP